MRPIPTLVERATRRVGQLLRYATVSAIATAVGLSVLAVLVGGFKMSPGWANAIATGVGTVPSFELNRRWVWRHADRSLLRQALPFAALALVELVVSSVVVDAAAGWAGDQHFGAAWRVAVVLGANVAAFGSLWVAQFVICDRVLFRRPAARAGALAQPAEEAVCR